MPPTSFLSAARSPGAAATWLPQLSRDGLRWASMPRPPSPPGLIRLPTGHTSSQASVCSFKSTKLAQMISEVQSEHSSYFFRQIFLDVCLSETFCLALSSKNVCPLLQLAPFTTLDEEPFAKRGSWPSTPTPRPTRSCAPLISCSHGTRRVSFKNQEVEGY